MKNLLIYGPLIHILILGALIIVVAIEVHWAAAALFAWMAYTITSFATATGKLKLEFEGNLKSCRKEFKDIVDEAADEVIEKTEKAQKERFLGEHTPPPKPSPDKPKCGKCLAEATNGAIVYNQNNCPIHD